MKKKSIKSLELKKRSISNLNQHEVKGGTVVTFTVWTCWSCLSCPTVDCTEGVICNPTDVIDPVIDKVLEVADEVIN